MSFKSIVMIKHEDTSKAGVKRVILKSKDWNGNHDMISKAIFSKWGLKLGEDCHTLFGDCSVDDPKSLKAAFSKLKDTGKVNVIVKDGALQSKMETMLIFGSKKVETSVADDITLSELNSLIGKSFGMSVDKRKDIKIYQIDDENDTDNLDIEINENDDLEGAIEAVKDDNGKLYLLVKGPGGGTASGSGGDDDDTFKIVINAEEADCKNNIEITILKVTTDDSNEADEKWMANYQDVLSGISEKLEDDDWTKSYLLIDDEGEMEINTLEDFKDTIEATSEDNNGAPIYFTLKSKSGNSGNGSIKKLFIFTANGSSITWEPEKDSNNKIKWGLQRVKLIRKLKKQFDIKNAKWSLNNDSSKVLTSNTVEKLWNELESSKNVSEFTFVLDGQVSIKKSGLTGTREMNDNDSKKSENEENKEMAEKMQAENDNLEKLLNETEESLKQDNSPSNVIRNYGKVRAGSAPDLRPIKECIATMSEGWKGIMSQLDTIRAVGEKGEKMAKKMTTLYYRYWRLLLETNVQLGKLIPQGKIQQRAVKRILKIIAECEKKGGESLKTDDKQAYKDCLKMLSKWIDTSAIAALIVKWTKISEDLKLFEDDSEWKEVLKEAAKLAAKENATKWFSKAKAWFKSDAAKSFGKIVLGTVIIVGVIATVAAVTVATAGVGGVAIAGGMVAATVAEVGAGAIIGSAVAIGAVTMAVGAARAYFKVSKLQKETVKIRNDINAITERLKNMLNSSQQMATQLAKLEKNRENMKAEFDFLNNVDAMSMMKEGLQNLDECLVKFIKDGNEAEKQIEKAVAAFLK